MVNLLAVAKDRLRQGRPDIAEAICADLAAAVQDDAEVLHIYGLALLARSPVPAPPDLTSFPRPDSIMPFIH